MSKNLRKGYCLLFLLLLVLLGGQAWAEELHTQVLKQKLVLQEKLDLAEKYAYGIGIVRDPIKAYGLVMETESISSCDGCDALIKRRLNLESQLAKELAVLKASPIYRPPLPQPSYFQQMKRRFWEFISSFITK